MVGTNGSERLSRPERGVLLVTGHIVRWTHETGMQPPWGWPAEVDWSGIFLDALWSSGSIHSRLGRLERHDKAANLTRLLLPKVSTERLKLAKTTGQDVASTRQRSHEIRMIMEKNVVMWCDVYAAMEEGCSPRLSVCQRCSMGILLSSSGPSSTSLFLIASVKRFFQYCSHGRKMPERCVYINASKNWLNAFPLAAESKVSRYLIGTGATCDFGVPPEVQTYSKCSTLLHQQWSFKDFKGCSVEYWQRLVSSLALKTSCGYGSIPINTIFSGMNIHLPAILMFTRGTRFWHTAMSGA